MAEVLVTGGTGMLGSALVPALRTAGHSVRVLSRRPGSGRVVGDVLTGAGVESAVTGSQLVIHAASNPRDRSYAVERAGTRLLVDACRGAGVEHLLYVSIVGVDRHPYSYYRAKRQAEVTVAAGGLPYTVLRAAQFHNLIDLVLSKLVVGPLLAVPAGCAAQPVAVDDVAAHITDLLAAGAVNGLTHYAGPQTVSSTELARQWLDARGRRARTLSVWLPGRVWAAYRAGRHLAGDGVDRGTISFAEWLRSPAGRR